MLTVDKLVKTKEHNALQATMLEECLNQAIAAIDIFKSIENKDEWKQKREEIKRTKEIEMEERELNSKNKERLRQPHNIRIIKENQIKLLKHRERLQKMHDERINH